MNDALAEWSHAVEAGKIAEFARAVGTPASDRAPPTFTMAAGAGMVEHLVGRVLQLDGTRTVHGEQAYDYLAPIHAGMTLACRADAVSDIVKPGRMGDMRVVTLAVTYADASTRDICVRETMTILEKAAIAVAANTAPSGRSKAPDLPRGADADAPLVATLGPVTRTDLVRYAGASGDFNPLHHDPDFARAAGLADVMAHGMYSAGLVASQVERWFGAGSMARFAVRFRAPVWLGVPLVLSGQRSDDSRLDLTLRQGGDVVLSATIDLAGKGS